MIPNLLAVLPLTIEYSSELLSESTVNEWKVVLASASVAVMVVTVELTEALLSTDTLYERWGEHVGACG